MGTEAGSSDGIEKPCQFPAGQQEKCATVREVMDEVVEQICNNYCKYPAMYQADFVKLLKQRCEKCPLNRL